MPHADLSGHQSGNAVQTAEAVLRPKHEDRLYNAPVNVCQFNRRQVPSSAIVFHSRNLDAVAQMVACRSARAALQ